MPDFETAQTLLREFKGKAYAFGDGVLTQSGSLAAPLGRRAVVIGPSHPGGDSVVSSVLLSLQESGVQLLGILHGVRPNTPREDLLRLVEELRAFDYDILVVVGGGSTIDAAKAAEVLRALGGSIDPLYGTGRVTAALAASGQTLRPLVAIQTAASSGAHLTKYSNITNLDIGQKKLIVDEALVPAAAVFQYDVTRTMPAGLTADGALDGHSHALEVLYGAVGKSSYARISSVATTAIRLIVQHLPTALRDPENLQARAGLGLATDLGGYAIMLGATNGGHLTSFSFVDLLAHGRACALLNPYYTVLFAPAIEEPLRAVGAIYQEAGLTEANLSRLRGRQLGLAVAEAMMNLSRHAGLPTRLAEVAGFEERHVARALTAAKDPQLKMKLESMPIALAVDRLDRTLGSVLEAATTGDLTRVASVRE